MGFLDSLRSLFSGPQPVRVDTEPGVIYLPAEGTVIPLQEIGDGVFSEGILGPGCGFVPEKQTVYSPVDGEVTQTIDTKHAVGLMSKDGAEILVHIGMDTVEMNGDGFEVLVKKGQQVRCGQPIMKFSKDKILQAGHPLTSALVVTNADDLSEVTVLGTGEMDLLSPVIRTAK